jgi:predicted nucleotidyltransferase
VTTPKDKPLCARVALSAEHLRILLQEIERHIPTATVWAFGSRVKGSHRPQSDLDLAVLCDKEITQNNLPHLNEALDESNLPFRVQTLDFHRLPQHMQDNIQLSFVVLYQPKPEKEI